ncbi:MAG: response regulator [Candidatus Cryptobacteroides sp.]|jgi:DNA-binding NarL/FixJ family response regulator
MTDPIHVFIVEDHPLVRIGLQTALSRSQGKFVLAGVADCVETFWDRFPKTNPDLILLDIMLPDGSGIDIAKRLREEGNPVRILVLSAETDEDTVTRLLQIGIDGFVSKMVPTQELFTAIEYVYHGAEFYGKDISKIIRDVRFAKRDVPAEFTERENDIIELCIQGLSAKEIAKKLSISTSTVNTHKDNIFKKLGINSSVELVRWAFKYGIIPL